MSDKEKFIKMVEELISNIDVSEYLAIDTRTTAHDTQIQTPSNYLNLAI